MFRSSLCIILFPNCAAGGSGVIYNMIFLLVHKFVCLFFLKSVFGWHVNLYRNLTSEKVLGILFELDIFPLNINTCTNNGCG
jgi:hypothetical protein